MNFYFALKHYIKKKFPLIVKFKYQIFSYFEESSRSTKVKLWRDFPLYIPYSNDSFQKKVHWIFEAINKIFPLLYSLGKYVKDKEVELESIEKLCFDPKSMANAESLKKIFDKFGSAKHDYHYLYSTIFKNPSDVKNIFEIGIGNNDTYKNIDKRQKKWGGGVLLINQEVRCERSENILEMQIFMAQMW